MRTLALLWRTLLRSPVALGAAVVGAVLLIASIAAPLVADADVAAHRIDLRLEAPSWLGGQGGVLGTDELGRDVLLQILYGLRTSFGVALPAVLIGAALGTAVGLIAAYKGGRLDALLMRAADVQMALPALLFVMVLAATIGGGARMLMLVLGFNSWMVYARVVRSAAMSMRSSDLIIATEGLGATGARILVRHMLPGVTMALLAVATLEFARIMLAEASLSFLGFGVQPPQVSLGLILSSGRAYLQTSWWVSTFSGLALAAAVLSTNLVGSWLQQASDPSAESRRRSSARATGPVPSPQGV